MSAFDTIDRKTEKLNTSIDKVETPQVPEAVAEELEQKVMSDRQQSVDKINKVTATRIDEGFDIIGNNNPVKIIGAEEIYEMPEPESVTLDNFDINKILTPFAANDSWDDAPEHELEASLKSFVANEQGSDYDLVSDEDVFTYFQGTDNFVDAAKQLEMITQQAFGDNDYTKFLKLDDDEKLEIAKENWLATAADGDEISNTTMVNNYMEQLKFNPNSYSSFAMFNEIKQYPDLYKKGISIIADGDIDDDEQEVILNLPPSERALLFEFVRSNNGFHQTSGFWNSTGQIIAGFGKGAAENVERSYKGTKGMIGRTFTDNYDLGTQTFEDNKMRYIMDGISDRRKFSTSTAEFLSNTTAVLGDMGVTAGAALGTGGLSIIVTGSGYAGEIADSLQYDFGLDSTEALLWGAAGGTVQAAIENLQVGQLFKPLRKTAEKGLVKGAQKTMNKLIIAKAKKAEFAVTKAVATHLSKHIALENVEEASQAITGALTKYLAITNSENVDVKDHEKMFGTIAEDLTTEIIDGAKQITLVAGLGGSVGAINNSASFKNTLSKYQAKSVSELNEILSTMVDTVSDPLKSEADKQAAISLAAGLTHTYQLNPEQMAILDAKEAVIDETPIEEGQLFEMPTEEEFKAMKNLTPAQLALFEEQRYKFQSTFAIDTNKGMDNSFNVAHTKYGQLWDIADQNIDTFVEKSKLSKEDATNVARILQSRDVVIREQAEKIASELDNIEITTNENKMDLKSVEEQVVKILPEATVSVEGEKLTVTLKNGESVDIQMGVEGKSGEIVDNLIKISETNADSGTVSHEMFHFLENSVLSAKDIGILEKNGLLTEDARAESFAKYMDTKVDVSGIWNKLKQSIVKMKDVLLGTQKSEQVFEKAVKGKSKSKRTSKISQSNQDSISNIGQDAVIALTYKAIVATETQNSTGSYATTFEIELNKLIPEGVVISEADLKAMKAEYSAAIFGDFKIADIKTRVAKNMSERLSEKILNPNQIEPGVRPSSAMFENYQSKTQLAESVQSEIEEMIETSEKIVARKRKRRKVKTAAKKQTASLDKKVSDAKAKNEKNPTEKNAKAVAKAEAELKSFKDDVAKNEEAQKKLDGQLSPTKNKRLAKFKKDLLANLEAMEVETDSTLYSSIWLRNASLIQKITRILPQSIAQNFHINMAAASVKVQRYMIEQKQLVDDGTITEEEFESRVKKRKAKANQNAILQVHQAIQDKAIQKMIDKKIGKTFRESLVKHLDDYVTDSRESGDNTILNKTKSWLSLTTMALNFRSLLGQLTSIPIGFVSGGLEFGSAIKNLGSLTNDISTLNKEYGFASTRLGAGHTDAQSDIQSKEGKTIADKARRFFGNLVLSKYGDIVIYMGIAGSKYRQTLNRLEIEKPHWTEQARKDKAAAEALELAERTQQSGKIENLGDIQRNRYSSLAAQFQNTQLMQARLMQHNFTRKKTATRFYNIEMKKATSEEAKAELTKDYKAALSQIRFDTLRDSTVLLAQNAIYHATIAAINYNILGYGDDSEEEFAKYLSGLALSSASLMTGVSGVLFADDAVTTTLDSLLQFFDKYEKEPVWMQGGTLPLIGMIKKFNAPINILRKDIENDEVGIETLEKSLNRFFSAANQISKTIENFKE